MGVGIEWSTGKKCPTGSKKVTLYEYFVYEWLTLWTKDLNGDLSFTCCTGLDWTKHQNRKMEVNRLGDRLIFIKVFFSMGGRHVFLVLCVYGVKKGILFLWFLKCLSIKSVKRGECVASLMTKIRKCTYHANNNWKKRIQLGYIQITKSFKSWNYYFWGLLFFD